jgi:hypothetical protein
LRRKAKKLLEVFQQRKGKVAYVFIAAVHVEVGQSEELLLQRNGFCDQLLPCDGTVSDTGSVAKTMP